MKDNVLYPLLLILLGMLISALVSCKTESGKVDNGTEMFWCGYGPATGFVPEVVEVECDTLQP